MMVFISHAQGGLISVAMTGRMTLAIDIMLLKSFSHLLLLLDVNRCPYSRSRTFIYLLVQFPGPTSGLIYLAMWITAWSLFVFPLNFPPLRSAYYLLDGLLRLV